MLNPRPAARLAVLAVSCLLALSACDSSSSPGTATPVPAKTLSPAEGLAVLDGYGNPPPQAAVAAYDTALDNLASHCNENKQQIAAMISKAQDLLREKDHERTVRQLTAMMLASFPDEMDFKLDCSEVLALNAMSIVAGVE